jgi:hypothetical protein
MKKNINDGYKINESQVVTSALRYLSACNIYAWRNNNMGTARFRGGEKYYTFNGTRGVSDILGIAPKGTLHEGKILCMEAKRPGNINGQSDEQKQFQLEIEKNGGIYILFDSWEMLEKRFKELGIVK